MDGAISTLWANQVIVPDGSSQTKCIKSPLPSQLRIPIQAGICVRPTLSSQCRYKSAICLPQGPGELGLPDRSVAGAGTCKRCPTLPSIGWSFARLSFIPKSDLSLKLLAIYLGSSLVMQPIAGIGLAVPSAPCHGKIGKQAGLADVPEVSGCGRGQMHPGALRSFVLYLLGRLFWHRFGTFANDRPATLSCVGPSVFGYSQLWVVSIHKCSSYGQEVIVRFVVNLPMGCVATFETDSEVVVLSAPMEDIITMKVRRCCSLETPESRDTILRLASWHKWLP